MSQMPAKNGLFAQSGPSVMRYQRVETILQADPVLRDLLGPKDHEILKRNGEKQKYSKGVAAVTGYLHEKGIDASTAAPALVLAFAVKVLQEPKVDKGGAKEPETALPVPKKRGRPRLRDTLDKSAVKLVEKPGAQAEAKPAKKSVEKIVDKTGKKQGAGTTVKVPEPKGPEPKGPKPLVAQNSSVPLEGSVSPVSEGQPVVFLFVVTLSMLHGAYNLLKLFDHEPGAEKRLEKLAEQIDEMHRLRDITIAVTPDSLPPSFQHGS